MLEHQFTAKKYIIAEKITPKLHFFAKTLLPLHGNFVNLRQIIHSKLKYMSDKNLHFVVFCIGGLTEALHMKAPDVYHRLQGAGIIDEYIVPCYDVLHTFSKEYIVEDLIGLMKRKQVL